MPILGLRVTASVGGVVLAYECLKPKPPLPTACQRCCTFNTLAPTYDSEVEWDESTSGVLELRQEIAAYAKGKVLEVAGGTGRNLAFYTDAVHELLVIDTSAEMLKVGAGKVAALRAEGRAAGLSAVTLAVGDAEALPCESEQYDTVLDSFGLCSFERPQTALEEMKRWCASSPNRSPTTHPKPSPESSPSASPSPNPNPDQLQAERQHLVARARREQLGSHRPLAAAPPQPADGALGLLLGQGHPGMRGGRRPARG